MIGTFIRGGTGIPSHWENMVPSKCGVPFDPLDLPAQNQNLDLTELDNVNQINGDPFKPGFDMHLDLSCSRLNFFRVPIFDASVICAD